MTNPTDEARLLTYSYQNQLANTFSQAIIDFINRATSINPLNPQHSATAANEGDA